MSDTGKEDEPVVAANEEDEELEDEEQWKVDPLWETRGNSPIKGTKRASRQRSQHWDWARRLTEDHPLRKKGFTHICTLPDCEARPLKLSHSKKDDDGNPTGAWVTSPLPIHLEKHHPNHSANETNKNNIKKRKEDLVQAKFLAGDTNDDDKKDKKPSPKNPNSFKQVKLGYHMSEHQRILTAMCDWYVYSDQLVTERTFTDEYFQKMIKAINPNAPIITVYMLEQYIEAEFEVMMKFASAILDQKVAQSHGNPFAQGIHDSVTLENGTKYQSFAIQFIDPKWLANIVLCTGFEPCSDGTNSGVSELFRDSFEKFSTGHVLDDIINSMRSDRAAIGVSKSLGIEEQEGCDMHDGDKVGQSAVGLLVRSRNKVQVNPFPEGVRVTKKARDLSTHFSYGQTRIGKLHKLALECGEPTIKPQPDTNGTRIVASTHKMIYTLLRMPRSLKTYQLQNNFETGTGSDTWTAFYEFEAVLNVSRIQTTLAQYESLFCGAYGPLISKMTYDGLRNEKDTISVIDCDTTSVKPRLPRVSKPVAELSDIGKTCLMRARIEFERRFVGNDTDQQLPTKGSIEYNKRQKIASVLDLRTIHVLPVDLVKEAMGLLEEEYVTFYVQIGKYKRQEEQKKRKQVQEVAAEKMDAPCSKKIKAEVVGGVEKQDGAATLNSTYGSDRVDAATLFGTESDSDEDMEVVEVTEEDLQKEDAKAAHREYRKVFRKWHGLEVDWNKWYPNEKLPAKPDTITDLMQLNIGPLYKALEKESDAYGLLPLMASCSYGQLGALNAESYVERVNSKAKLVLTKKNSSLGDKKIKRLVMLRMNREFMKFMRKHYREAVYEKFGVTVVEEAK